MEFVLNNLEWIITTVISSIAGISMYFRGKKVQQLENNKSEKEIESTGIKVHEENIKLYQTLLDDLESRFKNRINILENDVTRMIKLNEEANEVINRQEKYINTKRKYITKLENILYKNKIKFDEKEY